MRKQYIHLSIFERDKINVMLSEKKSLGEIGKELGGSKSTISRKLKRNSSPEYKLYLSHRAHARSVLRREAASSRPPGLKTITSSSMYTTSSMKAGRRSRYQEE